MSAKSLLPVSVLFNVLLLGVAVRLWTTRPVPAEPASAALASTTTPLALRPADRKPRPPALTNTVMQRVDWRAVESEDYKKYIANLRSIGCPEETIRDIITADVNKLFEARRREITGAGTNKFQFWKSGATARSLDEERVKQFQTLAKEKRDLLRELLGIETGDPQDALAALTSQITDALGFLPPDRQAQLLELEQRYAARLAKFSGQTNAEAVASVRALRSEKEAELIKLLSPEERETYDLTTSRTAATMRSQLGDFNPNEQEFRDIFKARRQLDEEVRSNAAPGDPASSDRREAALLKAYNEIHKALGDDRWNDYRSAREWTAGSALRQVAEAANIPKADALKVPDIRDAARGQVLQLRANPTLSDPQRQAAFDAVRDATRGEILRVLGPAAGATYLSHPTTRTWMEDLGRSQRP
ncbi:MAG: hypothetical protein HZA89_15050 [Verrucomicrobia bacterium]|nr:hypothetical protein [Verrucomicrobiota bacterium]